MPTSHTERFIHCHHDRVSSRLKKLILKSRTDLTDLLFCHIRDFVSRLHYWNITACSLLTDHGISGLLGRCTNLIALLASDTALGDYSLLHLYTGNLTILDVSRCQGVRGSSLDKVFASNSSIQELGLREIHVDDESLSQLGCELVKLDLLGTNSITEEL
ncbi:hypothetical protein RND81_14G111500 [Saponaria officinalis]|uniref:Uncharacterized protein n=1 Tax=Saponaria officinalis TaxID=3572 RepID=A0AAW1GPG2_SAPOF